MCFVSWSFATFGASPVTVGSTTTSTLELSNPNGADLTVAAFTVTP
jgi:hypothetical protein